MNQITLAEGKAALSEVTGSSGMSVSDSRLVQYINDAIHELMLTGEDYPSLVDRWLFRFNQTTGHVALPYQYDRLMQVTIDHVPDTIVSPWFEFYGYGPGIEDDYDARGNKRYNWINVVYDRGDHPVQKQIPDPFELTGPWVLRVYATVDEEVNAQNPVINIQGLDNDGLIIRTQGAQWYNGVNVEIDNSVPFTQTTQEFSKISSVAKPETNGYVRLTAWNGTAEVELANFAWNETTPSYRHYYIPKLINRDGQDVDRILLGRCRKRFVAAQEDNDVLIVGNVPALKEMVIAQYKRLSDLEEYRLHKGESIALMRGEAKAYYGKSRIPALSMQRGFGIGHMPFYR